MRDAPPFQTREKDRGIESAGSTLNEKSLLEVLRLSLSTHLLPMSSHRQILFVGGELLCRRDVFWATREDKSPISKPARLDHSGEAFRVKFCLVLSKW